VAGNDLKGGELGATQPIEESEYGLIVVDLISRTVLSCNKYTNIGRFHMSEAADESDNENFIECAGAGLVRHSTFTMEEFEGGQWREIERSSTDRIGLSEALEKVKAAKANPLGIDRWDKSGERDRLVQEEFTIDASGIPGGMTLVGYDWRSHQRGQHGKENGQINPEMKAKLRELGIPLTFEEGLLRDASPCFPDFPLEYRFHLATANFLRPLDPEWAVEHDRLAMDAKRKAIALGQADSMFLRQD